MTIVRHIAEEAVEESESQKLLESEGLEKSRFTKLKEGISAKVEEKVNYLVGVVPHFGTVLSGLR